VSEGDELERKLRKLAVEHAETRWLALRLDDDVKELRDELRTLRREHTARFDAIDRELQEHAGLLLEHTGRFDSVDTQLRSLTQLVGQVLERLSEEPSR
jgi:uncharacterized protein involved in exopolysaccharide biosynthesis